MKLHLTTDAGQTVTLDVEAGDNVWITRDEYDVAGSLFISGTGNTIGLGCYNVEEGMWDYAETIRLRVPAYQPDASAGDDQ